jgi:hypothetical protein
MRTYLLALRAAGCLAAVATAAGCTAGRGTGPVAQPATVSVTSSPRQVMASTPAATITAPAGGPGRLVLTVTDSGRTITLRAGQAVEVALTPGQSWRLPQAVNGALRRSQASGGYPGSRPARAIFTAARPGTSGISSVTDARCLHASPRCEIPQRLWQVTVIIR